MADFDGARLFVYARSLGTVLRIDGEIDAVNATSVAQAIRRFALLKTPLILDLSQLFLSVDGFRALLVLNHEHQQARVHCSVVAGAALHPLLGIVGDHGLPVVGSVAEALQLIEDIVGSRRRFLAGMVRDRHARHEASPRRRDPVLMR
ncbi:STAS domain-containing protein [Mycobacterium palustre]|uniref:Sulfate transporter n=2 Tax=Mycobacterium palustre TaxID=153971 RepID=A0A1X1ZVS3_9MYCO|nr:STAS domain-containing protein [Mycobacterium palustre]MCV7099693.1 STAS domain-containing protein [Mycobacterium palustre]ORW27834.1 sulfate transporter [Mycobacterium palustre]